MTAKYNKKKIKCWIGRERALEWGENAFIIFINLCLKNLLQNSFYNLESNGFTFKNFCQNLQQPEIPAKNAKKPA